MMNDEFFIPFIIHHSSFIIPHPSFNKMSIISRFYTAFMEKDAETMASLYHPEATFRDPVFDLPDGATAGDMWRMLLKNGQDLRVSFGEVMEDEKGGSAQWEAWYTFSKTGRKVHNVIEAKFEWKDGLIYRHTDHFDFWRWSRQALGLTGWLLGWSLFLQNKVRATAMKGLLKFQESKK
jgi:ketosteroid isomerase-like protein